MEAWNDWGYIVAAIQMAAVLVLVLWRVHGFFARLEPMVRRKRSTGSVVVMLSGLAQLVVAAGWNNAHWGAWRLSGQDVLLLSAWGILGIKLLMVTAGLTLFFAFTNWRFGPWPFLVWTPLSLGLPAWWLVL